MSVSKDEQAHYRGVAEPKPHHPVFARFDCWSGLVPPYRDHNFLGVHTRTEYFSLYDRLADFSSARETTTSHPMQNEDYFEWVDLLEAVTRARDCFRMIELGAGWGRWIANGAAAARQIGLDYFVVGVEAEPKHFGWMRQHLLDNDFDLAKTELVQAAVAPEDGTTWFHVGEAADWYGQYVADPPAATGRRWRNRLRAVRQGDDARRVAEVRAISLRTLLHDDTTFDLVDSDVQGLEADVFEAAADLVDTRVRRVHIGTHSRDNEARLRALFTRLGWEKVNDFPGNEVNETSYGPMPFEDGVQTWVNPRSV